MEKHVIISFLLMKYNSISLGGKIVFFLFLLPRFCWITSPGSSKCGFSILSLIFCIVLKGSGYGLLWSTKEVKDHAAKLLRSKEREGDTLRLLSYPGLSLM